MAVDAQPVNFLARTTAGSVVYDGPRLVTSWHHHDGHQLEYALAGTVEVESGTGHHLLPPQQAAWIPAGLAHRSTLGERVRTISVFFDPALLDGGDRIRIVAVTPLLREMVIHAERWPVEDAGQDVSESFFRTLAHLVGEALDQESPLVLPRSSDPMVAAAMDHTRQHLDVVSFGDAARAVGASERTLRRAFAAAGVSWRTYVVQARVLQAMAMLAEPGRTVLDVALAVGFQSPTAFARAFTERCGETPSAYRRRVSASCLGA